MRLARAIRDRIEAGGSVLGTWHTLIHPYVTELIARSGVDAVVIDQEHGPVDLEATAAATVILQAYGVATFVRVPWNDPVHIKRVLDIGVDGLMVPNVRSADEARAAVAACRYPPKGGRGIALGAVRAGEYGADADAYQADLDDTLFLMLQIESVAGVEAIPEIATVDGVAMLFIGPNDLSGDMGRPRRMDDPAVRAMIHRAERAIVESAAWLGSIPSLGRDVPAMVAAGCDFVCAGAELPMLRDGLAALVTGARGPTVGGQGA